MNKTIYQFLDKTGLEKVWTIIKAKFDEFYNNLFIQSNGEHVHDIMLSHNVTPKLKASLNDDGVLVIEGNNTYIELQGNTNSAGSHTHNISTT